MVVVGVPNSGHPTRFLARFELERKKDRHACRTVNESRRRAIK